MLKAKRKTYGNTPWGRAWVEALERIDSNRLARGKSYANTGRVLSVSVSGHQIAARVKGSFYDSYDIKIALTPFSKKDTLILRDVITQQPSLSIELGLGTLPEGLLSLLQAKGIPLLPTRWKDLQARCSCPDSSNPCKHLAAVYYILANEIDRDPFLLFNLKGLPTAELIGNAEAGETSPAITRPHPALSACASPETLNTIPSSPNPESFSFRFPRHDIRPVLALLPDNPPFYTEGNFKDFLENLYHQVPTEAERLFSDLDETPILAERLFQLEWIQDEYSPRHLCRLKIAINESQLDIETAQLQAAFQPSEPVALEMTRLWSLGTPDTRFKPASYKALALTPLGPGLDYFLRASLTIDSHQASDSFLFLNLVASCALALVQANLFVPDCLYENTEAFRIRYVPLIGQPVVKAVITQLEAVMPREIAHYKMKFLAPAGLSELLSLFITHIIHTILAQPVRSSENRIVTLFCEDTLFRPSRFTERRIGGSIANWLEKLHLGKRDIAPVIRIETAPRESFKVFVDVLNRKSALDPIVPFARLFETTDAKRKKPASSSLFNQPLLTVQQDVSRQLIMAGGYLPELKVIVDQQGTTAPVVSLERMSALLLNTAPVLDVLGIQLILPKALKKLVSPNLQMKAKLRKSNETGASYLNLDEMLAFSYEIALGDERISAQEFRKLVKQTGGLVKFKDQYVLLSPEEVQTILRKLKEPLPDLASPMQALYAAMTGEVRGLPFQADTALQRVLDDLTRVEEVCVPGNLQATLRPYQERGFRWLWTNSQKGFGSCIADDMGLGKTIQIITLFLHAKSQGKQQVPSLVVCPTTLIGNWEKECARFAPSLKVSIYHGHERRLDLKQADVVITSFGVFRRDLAKFASKAWAFLVVDEAQNIKNSETAQTKAIKSLKAQHVIAMTGTPVENRLTELWNLFDFINPGYLGTLSQFKTELANPIEKTRDTQSIEKLKRATAPFLLRRLKTDKSIIADLPDKLTMDEYCYLTQAQAAIYQNVVDRILNEIQSSEGIERKGLIFKLMTTLKQICNHPTHFANQGNASSELSGKAAKTMATLKSLLERGEKALIFTQYREMGELLVRMIQDELKTSALFFHGGLPRAKRDEMVRLFQEDRQSRLMILSLKAGGTGLNLTAASNVIHYDLWWNPAVENQATDRAYRIGQNRNVLVHRMITLGTFEEKIDEMIKAKQELANLTVATGENWITELSNQQLQEIFSLSATVRH